MGFLIFVFGLFYAEILKGGAKASAFGGFISFDERQKKRTKEKRFSPTELTGDVRLDVIFRLAILARSENAAHPCAAPYGSGKPSLQFTGQREHKFLIF